MKKIYYLTVLLLCLHIPVRAGDFTMFNLYSPTSLEQRYLNFSVRHRFYGDITDDPIDTFFGMDAGANIRLHFSYQLLQNMEIKTSYTRFRKEKTLGLSYKIDLSRIHLMTQIDIEYFSFKNPALIKENRTNMMGLISIQNRPVSQMLVGTLNIGYDGYFNRLITGVGITVSLVENISLFEQISMVGEFYPVLDRKTAKDNLSSYIGPENGFSFGIKLDTYGHRFLLFLTNTTELHLRHASLGIDKNSYWRLGFNIDRRIKL